MEILSFADWIAIGIVAAAVICAAVFMIKNRGKGCSGGCGSCPYSSSCGRKDNDDERK
ncbi:MAG: FeoB-associated Cys-rich membrane protein [Oscillospiraceae bacterium]